jgi:hypothetical protein
VNGDGTVLATMALSLNNASCMSFASYCKSLSAGMSGRKKSGGFSGEANGIGTDGPTPRGIPEPSMFYMLGSGLIGIFAARVPRLRGIHKATTPTASHCRSRTTPPTV